MNWRWATTTLLVPMAWRVANYWRDLRFYAKERLLPLTEEEVARRIKFYVALWDRKNK